MKPILNLYVSSKQARDAFDTACQTSDGTKFFRDLMIKDADSMTCFRWYDTYESARQNELCSQWGEINFFVDLPSNVKSHYLSRIRWVEDNKFYSS